MMMCCHDDARLLPRSPVLMAPRFWLAALSLLALLAPAQAGAQCVLDGTTVTCTGSDPDGFDAGATDGLQVDVLPDASVDNGGAPGVNTLNLANDNVVDIQAGVEGESAAGEITASGAGSHGISAIDDNTIANEGSIVVTGAGGSGISLGNRGAVANNGTIALSGGGNRGVITLDEAVIYNNGTITAAGSNSIALAAGSIGGDVRNNLDGEITLEGDDSIAIQVADDNGLVYNEGTIQANGDRSIGMQFGDGNAFVSNIGTITITGNDGIGMDGGDGNGLGGGNNGVYNSGTLEISGASGIGIRVGDDNLVISDWTISVDGSDGIGVLLGTATGTGNTLRNFGTITGGDGSGAAVSFEPSGSGSSNILRNRGRGEIDGSASGVAVLGSAGVDSVRNEGTITGDVRLADGDDFFGLWTEGVINGAVEGGPGSDTLRLLGSGTDSFDLSILSDFELLDIVEGGTWRLSGAGSFPEGATVTDGTLALDGRVDLSGDYLQGTGTSLLVRLNPDGTNDLLAIDGNATIEAGAILQLEPTALLTDDATYEFLTATGTLTGLFDETNFPDGTGAVSISQVTTADGLAIEYSRLSYTNPAATGNQMATAVHLDEILAAGPPADMATVLTSLDTLSTPELQAALDALHPEAYDAQASAMFSFGRSVAESAAFRRPRCEEVVYERRPQIIAPSPCSQGWMLWGSAFGLFGKREGDGGHIDFDHGGGGMLLGADYPLGEHFLVYGFLGGGYTGVDVDVVGDGHIFSATLGAGTRWSLGGTRIHGLLGYARGWHEQKRSIDFGEGDYRIARTAKADYESNLIMALVKAGHTFRFGSLDVEPLATVEYGYLMEESFRESGAIDIDLDVDERSNSLLSTTVGARLAYTLFKWEYLGDYLEWADGVWTPEVTARWRGNWIGTERDLDARLVGAPAGVSDFTVGGQDAEQGVQVGAGVAFRPLRVPMSIRFDYDGFYGDGSMIHRIGASIRIPLGGSAS